MTTLCWTYDVITRNEFMMNYGIPLGEKILSCYNEGMKKLISTYTGDDNPKSLKFYRYDCPDGNVYGVLWDDNAYRHSRFFVSLWGLRPFPYTPDAISLAVFAEAVVSASFRLGADRDEALYVEKELNAVVAKYHYDVENFGDYIPAHTPIYK